MSTDPEFAADVAALRASFLANAPPPPDVLARVMSRAVLDLASIATSLARIAEAQGQLAGLSQNDPG